LLNFFVFVVIGFLTTAIFLDVFLTAAFLVTGFLIVFLFLEATFTEVF